MDITQSWVIFYIQTLSVVILCFHKLFNIKTWKINLEEKHE